MFRPSFFNPNRLANPPKNVKATPAWTYARLPQVPINGSPVPHLTSLYHFHRAGEYGDRKYRGNCGGNLIRDLLQYFGSQSVLDPMSGSGTCGDVCQELGIPCHSLDLRRGHDAANPASYAGITPVDFVWMHPPYWRMIRYNDDPRCLSQLASLEEFLSSMQAVLRNCRSVLKPRGKIAVLIGGYSDKGRYQPLAQLLLERAIREGLWPACTEIVRFQHGNTSSKTRYRCSFIPGLHDICQVFEVGS